jgi:murein L,D-transpeptidase YafK
MGPVMRSRIVVGCALFALLLAGEPVDASAPGECPREASIVVDTGAHRLSLCEGGKTTATYSVRIGKKGTGKTREGDGKTPLGRYPIGAAHPSAAYGQFMPIGYPTAEQRRQGYTGSAVGVHGPDRRLTWAGRLVNAFDTTDGCVGIATDEEMSAVAAWAKKAHVTEIVLR